MDESFDTIIIGSGQSGNPLAVALASSGQKVALIERDFVGGTCINYGCTPTKTLVASSTIASLINRSTEYGIELSNVRINMAAIRDRKRKMVESWRNGSESYLESTEGLELIFGEAKFVGPKTISIQLSNGSSRILTGTNVVINTGGKPTIPKISGLDTVDYLDSTSIMELDLVPKHLIIIGGGYIACEFAQMFNRFGSRVTIIQRGPQLFGREDDDVAEAVAKIFDEDGIEIKFGAETQSVASTLDGIALNYAIDGQQLAIHGSHLLIAIGRSPNVTALDLNVAGIATDSAGFIKVNDRLETNSSGVYATGDVKGGPAFTHISYDDFRILKRRLVDGDLEASIAGRLVPYTVFIDPQLGRIGLNEREAKQQGRKIRVAKMPMTRVARAVEMGEARGFLKAIVDGTTDEILGCAVLGFEGGEIMAMLQIAIMGKLPFTALRDGIFAHPTLAESLNNLFASI